MAKAKVDAPAASATVPATGNQAQRQIRLDDSEALSTYANFCRVTGSPEELIIDFGMNTQPMGAENQSIDITQRVVLNFYTAKRLLHALHVSVQRHEEVFGNLETDVQKRVVNRPEGEKK